MSKLPRLPGWTGEGYSWMDGLDNGWYSVALWGSDGWDLGRWPLMIIVHYDGDDLYGYCSYTEGDLDIHEFCTRKERDDQTNEYFVWFNNFHDVPNSPRTMTDGRLGPYKG